MKIQQGLLGIFKKYNEDELVMLLQKRDKDAFVYLYDNYSPSLFRTIYQIFKDVQISEDVLQEVFLKIWYNFSTYDKSRGRLYTWMLNLTKNLAIDLLRSKDFKKQLMIFGDQSRINNLPDQSIRITKFDSLGIRKHLEHLNPDQMKMINMAYFNGYTQIEIAIELEIPLGTVKTKMRNAILKLKKIL